MATKKLTGRGGPGRGQGRKPAREVAATEVIAVRATTDEKAKFAALGGVEWFRRVLERAKLPGAKAEA